MNIEIKNPQRILTKSIEDACGLTAYKITLDLSVDISNNKDYQKNFTAYYNIRRDQEWLKKYYNYLEANKNNKNITFEKILLDISKIEHTTKNGLKSTVEASFASKMLATIIPDNPIWDKRIAKALGIKLINCNKEEKISTYVKIYDELREKVKEFINTKSGKECIRLFNKTFPNYTTVSNFKKIDHYLWSLGRS